MEKKYHFISGLPRSGSTLLTAILLQNPKFHSNISDQLSGFVLSVIETLGRDPAGRTTVSQEVMLDVINGIFDGYYKKIDKEVIFNCSRGWTREVEYLYSINKEFKIICCVRNFNLILNSMEALYKKRRLIDSSSNHPIYVNNTLTVWHRTNFLANDSFVRAAYNNVKEAYYGPYREHLLFVDYDDLTKKPKQTLYQIYKFIGEPYYFDHDFDNVEYSNFEYDEVLSMPGLHTVKRKVEYNEPKIVLPPDLMETYSKWEFWK
jgi:sulfotransferase